MEEGSQSRYEEVLAVGSLPWPAVRSSTLLPTKLVGLLVNDSYGESGNWIICGNVILYWVLNDMSTCLVLCRNQHLILRLESGEVVTVDQFWWEGTAASSLWLLCSNSDQPKIISDKCISKKGAYKYFPHMLLLCIECSAYTLVTTRRK